MDKKDREAYYENLLGKIIYKFGIFTKTYVCEGGIAHTNGDIVMAWDDIFRMVYYPVHHVTRINFMPVSDYSDATFTAIDKADRRIKFTANEEKGEHIWKLYTDKVFDKRWENLIETISDGSHAVLFGELGIGLNFIGKVPRKWRWEKSDDYSLHDIISLERIINVGIENGKIQVSYIDDKGKTKRKTYGELDTVPDFNIPLIFLNLYIQKRDEAYTKNVLNKE
jgi:hypothetical protein